MIAPRSIAAVAALAALSSCGALPEDHYARQRIQSWAAAMHDDVDPAPYARRIVRGLDRIGDDASALLTHETRATTRLSDDLGAAGGALARQTTHAPRRIADAGRSVLGSELDRAHSLVADDGAAARWLSPADRARDLRRGLGHLPFVLGIDHRPLPSPTDPERQVSLEPPPRRETFGERLLRRLWP